MSEGNVETMYRKKKKRKKGDGIKREMTHG